MKVKNAEQSDKKALTIYVPSKVKVALKARAKREDRPLTKTAAIILTQAVATEL